MLTHQLPESVLSGVPEQTPLGHCLSIQMSTAVFLMMILYFLYPIYVFFHCTVCYVMDYRGFISSKSQITVTDFYCHKVPNQARVMGLIN